MPKLLIEVPDTEAGTARPVTLEIIRQVMKATGLDKTTTILYNSEDDAEAQLGSRLDGDDEKNKFPSTEKLIVDVEEEYVAERILATAIYRPENSFIFSDTALSTYIKPAYSSTEVTINFRYRALDKVAARRWRDDIRNRVSMMRDVNVHTVDYHYLIPPELLYILEEIHRLRELQAGYGQDFETYFNEHATQRATILTNLSGTKDARAIAETQLRIQGWFEFEGVPEKGDKENDTNAWTIGFSYKFKYDKPLACVMHYPLMIHNQTLSAKYRDSKTPYEEEHQQRSYSLSMWHLSHFEKNPIVPQNPNIAGIGIPAVDDFIPSQVLPSSMRVLTALVKLDTTDKKTLLDLKALNKYTLNEIFMDFLQSSEAPFVHKPYQSIINVSVYRNTNIVPFEFITVNNQAVISATEDLNLRDYHHVRLSLITDLSLLSKAALERLRENGCAFRAIMLAIAPELFAKGLLPESMCKLNYITREQLGYVLNELEKPRTSQGDHQTRQFNTVMGLYVQSHRMEES